MFITFSQYAKNHVDVEQSVMKGIHLEVKSNENKLSRNQTKEENSQHHLPFLHMTSVPMSKDPMSGNEPFSKSYMLSQKRYSTSEPI